MYAHSDLVMHTTISSGNTQTTAVEFKLFVNNYFFRYNGGNFAVVNVQQATLVLPLLLLLQINPTEKKSKSLTLKA